ncbi:hypothetical protein SAMN05216404_11960 [Nitrosospira multiformis]|uniref:Uncharacterized protein n=1 Tax=Nitrosospira multiformis TaxID=1231 RepID=A0A1H8P9L6_9PROT|nr:hypothetical protein SAMN05216404_11960 [Nitrosospira multiformis]
MGIDIAATEKRSPSILSKKLEPGQTVVVDGVPISHWEQWKTFISEYELVCRAIPPFDRPLLVCIVYGVERSALPKGDITLGIAIWEGVLSEIDMIAYAGSRVRERGMKGVHGQLIATTVARLAQWDVVAADLLLDAETRELFLPERILGELADSYGWTKERPPSWSSGTVDIFDGRRQIHSAFLSLNDPTKEVRMRVWSSQASSLLPLIELHRRSLVRKIRHRLKLPVQIDAMVNRSMTP